MYVLAGHTHSTEINLLVEDMVQERLIHGTHKGYTQPHLLKQHVFMRSEGQGVFSLFLSARPRQLIT